MFRPNAVVARQRKVERVFMDTLDCPTLLDGCMATKSDKPQQYPHRNPASRNR
jgi:hypothetical protein